MAGFARLDTPPDSADNIVFRYGGVLVSTWEIRQRRHAEAGTFAKDAGSTPAASSLRSSAARTKTAAPESAFGTKAGFVKRRGSARTTCRAEVRRKRATRQASKPEMEFCYVCILQSQVEP